MMMMRKRMMMSSVPKSPIFMPIYTGICGKSPVFCDFACILVI